MIFVSLKKDHRSSCKYKNPHMVDFLEVVSGLLHDPHWASLESKSRKQNKGFVFYFSSMPFKRA